jgi:methylated-DNA-[protein]-cysteine S-methyltransferase
MKMLVEELPSPIGRVIFGCVDNEICALSFADGWDDLCARISRREPDLSVGPSRSQSPIRRQLKAYFDGDLSALDHIKTRTQGTSFQQTVWKQLRKIRTGTTITYGELASRVGKPSAARAVGTANGANPISIIVPCHRVIAAGGHLGGYAYGLDRKQWLLAHEGAKLL